MFFCGNNCSALFTADPFKLSVPDGAVLWGVLNINAAGRADPGAGGAPDTGFGSFGIWSVNAFLNSSKNWTDGRRAKRLAASDTKPAQDALPGICFERERGMRRDMAEPHQFHNCGVIRCLRVHQAEQCFSYSLNSFRIGIHPQTLFDPERAGRHQLFSTPVCRFHHAEPAAVGLLHCLIPAQAGNEDTISAGRVHNCFLRVRFYFLFINHDLHIVCLLYSTRIASNLQVCRQSPHFIQESGLIRYGSFRSPWIAPAGHFLPQRPQPLHFSGSIR